MFKIIRNDFRFSENLKQFALCHKYATKLYPDVLSTQAEFVHHGSFSPGADIRHIITGECWNRALLKTTLRSASKIKSVFGNTHGKKMNLLPCTSVLILDDHNEPILRLAVTKAVTMLGASDVHIRDKIDWDHDYQGRVFSEMADVIFVSSETEGCLQRFTYHSSVPVVCMRSRKHASLQSLATIMSMIEDHGSLESLNVAYVGAPHQVLNDYLIFCPMLKANVQFKCCCKTCTVNPLLLEDSKALSKKASTKVIQVLETPKALENADIIVAGPTSKKKEKIPEFELSVKKIEKYTDRNWTYYHTLPRGGEANDKLFYNPQARTFNAFKNTQYVAAAMLLYVLHRTI